MSFWDDPVGATKAAIKSPAKAVKSVVNVPSAKKAVAKIAPAMKSVASANKGGWAGIGGQLGKANPLKAATGGGNPLSAITGGGNPLSAITGGGNPLSAIKAGNSGGGLGNLGGLGDLLSGLAPGGSNGIMAGLGGLGGMGDFTGALSKIGNAFGGGKKHQDTTAEVQKAIDDRAPDPRDPLNGVVLDDRFKAQTPAAVQADQIKAQSAWSPTAYGAQTVKGRDLDPNSVDQRGLNALRDKATATGPSAWAKLATDQQGIDELNQKDVAGQQALTGAATARNMLAMKGGLGGGAAERIAGTAARGMNADRQAAARQGSVNRLNIGMQDESNKNQLLSQLPQADLANANFRSDQNKFNVNNDLATQQYNAAAGDTANRFDLGNRMDYAKFNASNDLEAQGRNATNNLNANQFNTNAGVQANQFDISNNINALKGRQDFDLSKYQTQMAGYGAAKTADAMANAGKK